MEEKLSREKLTIVAIIAVIAVAGVGVYLASGPKAEFEVTSLTLSPAEAKVGQTVTVSAVVNNTGNATGAHRVALTIGGGEWDAKEVTLAPNETKIITFTVESEWLYEGTYTIGVGELTKVLKLISPTPATFEVSNLVVNPSEAKVGEPIEISTAVKNIGDLEGTYRAVLTIDEVKMRTKDVTLAGGETKTVTFTVVENVAGLYNVNISRQAGDYTTGPMCFGFFHVSQILWSYQTGKNIFAKISSNGEYVVAGGYDSGELYFFSRTDNTPLWTYPGMARLHTERCFSISSDGSYVVAIGADNKLYLFNKVGTPLWTYQAERITYASISPDGNFIAMVRFGHPRDRGLFLFNRSSNSPLWSYNTGIRFLHCISFSADGSYIAAGASQRVYLFNKSSSTPLWTYDTGDFYITDIATSADGNYTAVSLRQYQQEKGKLYLFGKLDNTPLWCREEGCTLGSVSISADGNYISTMTYCTWPRMATIYLFERQSSTPHQVRHLWYYPLEIGHGDMGDVSISADGNYIVAGVDSIHFFSSASQTPLWFDRLGGAIDSISISSDGSYVALGTWGYEGGGVYLLKGA